MSIDAEIKVFCSECGDELDGEQGAPSGTQSGHHGCVMVKPCERCLEQAADDARELTAQQGANG